MIPRFFIDRPVFASVVAILMLLLGGISIPLLPVEQYPNLAPPVVQVSTAFPGADPQTLVDTVTAPLEQEINGVEGMIYMQSNSSGDGSVDINVSFELGTDPDLAAVYTQNRVAQAEPRLPEEVARQGVRSKKRSPNMLMVISLISPDQRFDDLYLSNYATLYIKDTLARVPGVGEVLLFGAKDFSMRLWLDPDKLAARDLTTADVLDALRDQNVQVAAGQIGQEPAKTDSGFQLTIQTQGRLSTVEEFENIILKVSDDQRLVRVGDIARVELAAQNYEWEARVNSQPSASMGIFQLPGSNAIDVADGIRASMDELARDFPQGLEYKNTFDFTRFVRASIKEVIATLLIAAFLVFLVTYLFLQDWRATLIPTITIPVSLIATFFALMVFGYSLNMLTLFGLILAIGIVVDDAIVVVENTSRKINEDKLDAKEAARQAMDEVSGALIATTLVVLAVFIPAACMGGLTGVLYRQFAITISIATAFSTINALTLSPMLCGLLLRPSRKVRFFLFVWFNKALLLVRGRYLWLVGKGMRLSAIVLLLFAGFCAATVFNFKTVPAGFIPDDDQGYFFVNIQLPDAAKLSRTTSVLRRVEKIILDMPGVADVVGITGYSFLDSTIGSNTAAIVVILEEWDQRPPVNAMVGQAMPQLADIQEAIVFCFTPPPIMGLGNAGGFQYQLQDRAAVGLDVLQDVAQDLVTQGNADPQLTGLFTSYSAEVPQLFIDIDRTKAQRIGVPLPVIFSTLQTQLGGAYVNDFNLFGRVFRVYAQADYNFRDRIDDIRNLKVRNRDGHTLPLDTVAKVQEIVGPKTITRYNLYPSASINGNAAPGLSSGQAVTAMQKLSARDLPAGFSYEWTGMTYQELKAGNVAPIVFGLGFIAVFLVLCAQYESWTMPIAILLTVPLGMLGALTGVASRGMDNNIYTQVGFVLLISLVAKNAILIVEFARELRRGGKSIREAALDASRLRFRAILMTAFSFVLGTFPLLVATGAGASSRQALGTAVFFGMIVGTTIGIVFVPIFFYLLQSLAEKGKRATPSTST